jgi:hypothetical protein
MSERPSASIVIVPYQRSEASAEDTGLAAPDAASNRLLCAASLPPEMSRLPVSGCSTAAAQKLLTPWALGVVVIWFDSGSQRTKVRPSCAPCPTGEPKVNTVPSGRSAV